MKRLQYIICVLFIGAAIVGMPTSASASKPDVHTLWAEGNDAYAAEDYDRAIASYEAIADSGFESDMLYYNLANAYFKRGQGNVNAEGRGFNSGELGKAILNYERALRLNPDMEDAEYNLALAYELTDASEKVPMGFMSEMWRSMSGAASSNTWTIVSLVMLAITLALVLTYLLANMIVLRKVAFFISLVTLLTFILTTALAIHQRSMEQQDNRAVIICNDTVAIHSEPDNKSTVLRTHSQGVSVEVLREQKEYSEVKFADGDKGWIRTDYIEVI